MTSDEKLARLSAANGPVISFDSKDFDLFTTGHRNFSLIVELTSLKEPPCDPCRLFSPSFDIVASSWAAVAEPQRLFFARLDYSRGQETFRKVGHPFRIP